MAAIADRTGDDLRCPHEDAQRGRTFVHVWVNVANRFHESLTEVCALCLCAKPAEDTESTRCRGSSKGRVAVGMLQVPSIAAAAILCPGVAPDETFALGMERIRNSPIGNECLYISDVEEYLRGGLGDEWREHVAHCEDCQELVELHSHAPVPVAAPKKPPQSLIKALFRKMASMAQWGL